MGANRIEMEFALDSTTMPYEEGKNKSMSKFHF